MFLHFSQKTNSLTMKYIGLSEDNALCIAIIPVDEVTRLKITFRLAYVQNTHCDSQQWFDMGKWNTIEALTSFVWWKSVNKKKKKKKRRPIPKANSFLYIPALNQSRTGVTLELHTVEGSFSNITSGDKILKPCIIKKKTSDEFVVPGACVVSICREHIVDISECQISIPIKWHSGKCSENDLVHPRPPLSPYRLGVWGRGYTGGI